MKLSYDAELNVAYIRLHDRKSRDVETISVSEDLNIDIAPDGTVYGIELLDAKRQLFSKDHGELVLEDENSGKVRSVKLA
ncbi:MAG: DUF2283 domain-containing protein [Planctomycetota bacterium]|nr:DUF2283 domain-containing protein [Planctomycetota bacterium]